VKWKLPKPTPILDFVTALPPLLWTIFATTLTIGFFFGTINALQTLFIKDTFEISATYLGLLLAGSSLFSIVSMILYPVSVKATWMTVGANVLLIISVAGFPFSPNIILTAFLLGISYSCTAYHGAAAQIMVDSITQPDVSVRVSGWNIACYSVGTAVASFAAGILYEIFHWLPFIASGGFTLIFLIPFIIATVRYYEHLRSELKTATLVLLVAAKWKRKAMQSRAERLRQMGEELGGAEEEAIETGSEQDYFSNVEEQQLKDSEDTFKDNSESSQYLGMIKVPEGRLQPPTRPSAGQSRSKSTDPSMLRRKRKTSSREPYQVDDPSELQHVQVYPPDEEGDYDENSPEHQRGLASRKAHYHSDVVQALNMNDKLGLGIFMRLKSLQKNSFHNAVEGKGEDDS